MGRAKNATRFFDRREPGPRYHYQEELVISFNAVHKPGTRIRVYPLSRWMEDCSRDTVVAEIGAFLNSAGCAVVKIPGDTMALTHVEIL